MRDLPDDWYVDNDGQALVLNTTKVRADLDRIKVWYDQMCDVTPTYAEEADHELAEKLGFRTNRPRPR